MDPEKCENSVVDENDEYKRRRCRVTGYLCRPTRFRDHGKSECVFEPKYLNNAQTKKMIKIIENLKPGMRVYWLYKTASRYYIRTQTHTASGIISKISEDGRLEITSENMKCPYYASIHDITRSIKLDREHLVPIMQQMAEELETEERIRKESGEE